MGTMTGRRKALVGMLVLLLAAGVPYLSAPPVRADAGSGHGHGHHGGDCANCPHHDGCPGCPGCGCECGTPKGAGGHDNAAMGHHGMHGKMNGGMGAPMKERMGKHLEEIRSTVKKLREIEARMAGQIRDGEAFRASSLEHARLLTDLQESHLKHMEGMMGGK